MSMDGDLIDRWHQALARPMDVGEPPVGRADGEVEAVVDRRNGRVRLGHLYQRQPLRVLTPTPATGEPLTLVVSNVSGGMVGGDRYRTAVVAEEGADLLVCGQAAEKVYRSKGADTEVTVDLSLEAGARMEWLPQGTILFDGARLQRRTTVDLAAGAQFLAGEILVFGRLGMGEVMRRGRLHDRWRLRTQGRLVWADALVLDDDIGGTLDHPAAFNGARALATVVYAARDAADLLSPVREVLAGHADTGVRTAATVWPGLLLMRILGADSAALRRAFGHCWSWLRAAALGRPATLPVLWQI
ncbi:MAG: urease accessory protein UreD [Rhodospirillaceae bacterium]|nr:urease accessory protein UreD [Rhodospirillaceae bacterium]